MLNSKGPRTDPCGTPLSKLDHELKAESILTLCDLSDK